MTDPKTVLNYAQVKEAGLDDWRMLVGCLYARFATGDFATGIALADKIGVAAEEANHHPDLDLRYPHLGVKLVSHDVGGITDRDVQMARQISALAAEVDVPAAPDAVQVFELALDATDKAAIAPFWAAVLGGEVDDKHGEVVDQDGQVPTLWFQPTDAHDAPRQRFHVDIVVAPEQAQPRIEAALAAGGTLVTDEHAPAFWVLADAEGNKVCVCTSEGRDN